MRITERQIRQIIREEIEGDSTEQKLNRAQRALEKIREIISARFPIGVERFEIEMFRDEPPQTAEKGEKMFIEARRSHAETLGLIKRIETQVNTALDTQDDTRSPERD